MKAKLRKFQAQNKKKPKTQVFFLLSGFEEMDNELHKKHLKHWPHYAGEDHFEDYYEDIDKTHTKFPEIKKKIEDAIKEGPKNIPQRIPFKGTMLEFKPPGFLCVFELNKNVMRIFVVVDEGVEEYKTKKKNWSNLDSNKKKEVIWKKDDGTVHFDDYFDYEEYDEMEIDDLEQIPLPNRTKILPKK